MQKNKQQLNNWQVKKIKDLLDYERPDEYIVKSTNYSENNKIPVLTANKSFVLGFTNENFGIYKNLPVIIFDDFTTDSKYVDFSFKVKSSAIKILKPKNSEVNLKFVYELMKSINFPVGNHKRYYISQYQNLDVFIPTKKEEQNKIAEILSTVDENIKKTDQIISKTEKLKKGLMQKLLTKGIGHKKFKKTKLGEIPEEWDIKKLSEICDVRDGTHESPKYIENGIPLITSKNLKNHCLDFNNINFISRSDYQLIEKRSGVCDGDILFGMIGTIGNPVLVKKDRDFAIKNVALVKFKNSDINNKYVYYYLCSRFVDDQFSKKQSGSTQKFVALGVIRDLLIAVTSKTEQKQIADILSEIDNKIEINKSIKNKLTKLKKGLMQDLLSGRVRV